MSIDYHCVKKDAFLKISLIKNKDFDAFLTY